jgi:hypothetical protein
MADLMTTPYLKYILHASVRPHAPTEDITYPIISEFLLEHKDPQDRFVIYPQLSLRWKPDSMQDNRAEVPDFGLGNFSLQEPYFKLRIGVEVKRSLRVMSSLPNPSEIDNDIDVMSSFHKLYFQGEDQAKAAIKGGVTFGRTVPYLLFIGPYWTSVVYGNFTPGQLEVRTHKPSGSGEFKEAAKAVRRLSANPIHRKLLLLGTRESADELGRIISSTDRAAESLRAEAATYMCVHSTAISTPH